MLSSDMVFVEEVAMSTIANMMSYLLSAGVLMVFMFWLDWRLGLIALAVTLLANVVARRMNAVSLKEAAARQEQGERLTDAVLSFVEGIGVIKSYNLLGAQSAALTENFARSRDVNASFERRMTPWTTGLSILYGAGIAAIFGLAVYLEQTGALSLAYLLGVLLFVFDLFGPLKALYGEATRLTVMMLRSIAPATCLWKRNSLTLAQRICQKRRLATKSFSRMCHSAMTEKTMCSTTFPLPCRRAR